jgi:hypothetical protein
MKPSEISLFTKKEQTLLVETENKRLEGLDEDALADILNRVRRGRKKYSDLDRRQSVAAIKASGRRAASASSNERTMRKAEIFEDAVSRVSRHLSRVARANANQLKRERLDAAKSSSDGPTAKRGKSASKKPASASRAKKKSKIVSPARKGATSASNKRSQARKDSAK